MPTNLLNILPALEHEKAVPELAKVRIPFVDIVRGYALFGIFLVRMVEVYSGWTTEIAYTLPTASTDMLLHKLIGFIASNKFRGLFSLLFGLSFYLQLQKAEQKGQSFQKNFIRRLGVLFIFGLLHSYLLWSGDILRWYAVAGLVVLFLYKLPTKALFFTGIVLTTVPIVAEELIHQFVLVAGPANPAEVLAVHTLTSTTSYWTMLQANIIIVNGEWLNITANTAHILSISGYFLIGIWIGQLQLWMPEQWKKQYVQNKKELQKTGVQLLLATAVMGVGVAIVLMLANIPFRSLIVQGGTLRLIVSHAKTPVLVALHVLVLFLLTQVRFLSKPISILSYAGRMTLTHYILQSIIGIGIFYGVGLGLWEKLGPTYTLPLTLVLFAGQVWLSKIYLSYFKSGPLEYVWRLMVSPKASKP